MMSLLDTVWAIDERSKGVRSQLWNLTLLACGGCIDARTAAVVELARAVGAMALLRA